MIEINGTKIGTKHRPYIIAELSANHGGDIEKAKKSIEAAKKAGANAVKLQTYTPETMTLDSNKNDFIINEGLWKGQSLYDLYKIAHTPFEWHKELYNFAKKIGISIFSTPFDESAVDLLDELKTPAFKIASFEITDLHLISHVASKSKPIFISTGMSSINEIASAVETCFNKNNKKVVLFHCISKYPVKLTEANLGNIEYLRNYFNLDIGLSDHTITNQAASLSIALGACAIEKHFKLDETECGPDSSFSILPTQLKKLVDECNQTYKAIKSNKLKRSTSELKNKQFRRSLYFNKNLKKNHVITEGDIRRVRPGFGLDPIHYDKVLGRKLKYDVDFADPVSWEVFIED